MGTPAREGFLNCHHGSGAGAAGRARIHRHRLTCGGGGVRAWNVAWLNATAPADRGTWPITVASAARSTHGRACRAALFSRRFLRGDRQVGGGREEQGLPENGNPAHTRGLAPATRGCGKGTIKRALVTS